MRRPTPVPADDSRSVGMAMTFCTRTPATPTSARPTGEAAFVVTFGRPAQVGGVTVIRSVVKVRRGNVTTWPRTGV